MTGPERGDTYQPKEKAVLETMLRQQDHHYFAADARLHEILDWISAHADALAEFGAEARQARQLPLACVALLRENCLLYTSPSPRD